MAIKQKFAKAGVGLGDTSMLGKLGASLALGMVTMLGSIPVIENLPMDDTVKSGSEVAVQEYDDALDILSTYNAVSETGSPTGLAKILALSEAGETSAEDKTDLRQTSEFRELGYGFGGSLIVDKRLSEKQKYDLVKKFENRIGEFEVYAGLDEPDYADLDEATARVTAQMDEHAYAQDIVEKSFKANDPVTSLSVGGGVAGGLFLLMLLASANLGRLTSMANQTSYKKPPKIRH